MKILFLSHSPDVGTFKVGSHHLARELSLSGAQVAHVSTPLSWMHKVLGRGDERRRELHKRGAWYDEFGTLHTSFALPLPLRLSDGGRAFERFLRRIEYWDADYILIDEPTMVGAISRRPPGLSIYRPTDIHRGRAADAQRRLVGLVHAVVATSQPVLDELQLPPALPSLVLENGVEFERFAGDSEGRRDGLVYVGALDSRFDWSALVAIAEAAPHERVSVVGPLVGHAPTLPNNVRLLGPQPYESVPTLLRTHRIGLLPLSDDDANGGRSPMKYYEYLAAGLSIVARNTPALARRNSPGVFLYDDLESVAASTMSALSASSSNAEGRRDAASQDWSNKAASLVEFIAHIRHDRP